MPKVKTHSGVKKRFKRTGTGKIRAHHNYRRHLLTKKTAKKKRQMRESFYLCEADAQHIKPLLPY
jgi:large subunit ribosomal protein L35